MTQEESLTPATMETEPLGGLHPYRAHPSVWSLLAGGLKKKIGENECNIRGLTARKKYTF